MQSLSSLEYKQDPYEEVQAKDFQKEIGQDQDNFETNYDEAPGKVKQE